MQEGITEGWWMGTRKHYDFSFSALKSRYCPYNYHTGDVLAAFTRKVAASRSLLGVLFQSLRCVDDEGRGIDPIHAPLSTDHFISKIWLRTPLKTDKEIEEKDRTCKTTTLSFALDDLLQRVVDSPT